MGIRLGTGSELIPSRELKSSTSSRSKGDLTRASWVVAIRMVNIKPVSIYVKQNLRFIDSEWWWATTIYDRAVRGVLWILQDSLKPILPSHRGLASTIKAVEQIIRDITDSGAQLVPDKIVLHSASIIPKSSAFWPSDYSMRCVIRWRRNRSIWTLF